MSEFVKKIAKNDANGENYAIVKEIQPQSSSIWVKMSVKFIRRGIRVKPKQVPPKSLPV
jgi:hypothetical protein